MVFCMKIKWKSCVPRHWENRFKAMLWFERMLWIMVYWFWCIFDTRAQQHSTEEKKCDIPRRHVVAQLKYVQCTTRNGTRKKNIILYLKWRIIESLLQIYTKYTFAVVFHCEHFRVYLLLFCESQDFASCFVYLLEYNILLFTIAVYYGYGLPFSMDHSCFDVVLHRHCFTKNSVCFRCVAVVLSLCSLYLDRSHRIQYYVDRNVLKHQHDVLSVHIS